LAITTGLFAEVPEDEVMPVFTASNFDLPNHEIEFKTNESLSGSALFARSVSLLFADLRISFPKFWKFISVLFIVYTFLQRLYLVLDDLEANGIAFA
jgi:hypothetical protein